MDPRNCAHSGHQADAHRRRRVVIGEAEVPEGFRGRMTFKLLVALGLRSRHLYGEQVFVSSFICTTERGCDGLFRRGNPGEEFTLEGAVFPHDPVVMSPGSTCSHEEFMATVRTPVLCDDGDILEHITEVKCLGTCGQFFVRTDPGSRFFSEYGQPFRYAPTMVGALGSRMYARS